MKRIYILIHILVFTSLIGYAQRNTDANMFGHVVNKKTGEHIPFISVALKGTTIGTATDLTGHYFLKNLPLGTFTVVATGIGYKPIEKIVVLHEGISLEVDFEVEEDKIMLEGVVVSANRTETRRREAPSIVNVLTPMLFENTNSVCLAQGLNFQPGVRVENNCQNCGFTQVRINGLDGPYSQILIDSRPVFSSLAGVYGLEQIPANMIERVEVVRGGGSAIFGSNAIAGTINIITREPVVNTAEFSNTTSLIYGRKTDINTTLNASVVSDDHKSGIMIFGSSRQRSPFDYNNDDFSEIGKLNAKNVGFRGYYKTGNYSKLSFEYHNLGEYRRGGDEFNLPPHEANIAEELNHNINNGGLKFDLFSKDYKHRVSMFTSMQKVERNSYYGTDKDPNAYGRTDDKTFVGGFQYVLSMDTFLFMPSDITLGAEVNTNKLNDSAPGYGKFLEQNVNTESFFIQNEWKSRIFSLLIGGRLDKHNLIIKPVFSPRLNVRYALSDAFNLRASYSGGFMAPQAFDEDLHVDIIGGRTAIIKLDPNLEMEKSDSYSASIDFYQNFGAVQTNFLVEGFYTSLNDVFVLEEAGIDDFGNLILERTNGSGALVAGINLEGRIIPGQNCQLQFGATFQSSKYKQPQQWSDNPFLKPQRKMFRTPDRYGYITFTCEPVAGFNFSLTGTYTGSMLVQHFAGYIPEDTQKTTPDFFDFGIRLSRMFVLHKHTKLQINGGFQNIFNSYQKDFDKGELRDAGYVYGPSLPRTVFLGIKLSI